MKKLIIALIAGSAMSTAAFAVEPAAAPVALSDNQMDMVTAGTAPKPASTTTQTNYNEGDTVNVGFNPTVALIPINFGEGNQTIGAYNPQRGPTQVNRIR
jgi:hypothetical protein